MPEVEESKLRRYGIYGGDQTKNEHARYRKKYDFLVQFSLTHETSTLTETQCDEGQDGNDTKFEKSLLIESSDTRAPREESAQGYAQYDRDQKK